MLPPEPRVVPAHCTGSAWPQDATREPWLWPAHPDNKRGNTQWRQEYWLDRKSVV